MFQCNNKIINPTENEITIIVNNKTFKIDKKNIAIAKTVFNF